MEKAIKDAIKLLAEKIKGDIKADDALKFTQSALNLEHVLSVDANKEIERTRHSLEITRPTMRAKLQVFGVTPYEDAEKVDMAPVCGNTSFGPDGNEDNTFSRWTPSGSVSLTITNPDLHGKFRVGQKFYADFTEAAE